MRDTGGRTWAFVLPFQDQARESVWNDHVRRALEEFDRKGFPYKKNETSMSLSFPGHGRFKLYGSDNDAALRSISNWGGIVVDEYDDCLPDLWDLTIRPNLMVHRAWAIVMGTPKGKKQIYRLEQEGIFKVFHYSSYDNPDLPKQELDELVLEYKKRGEDYYLQEIMAEYRKPVGVIFPEFEQSVHVVDPFPIPETWDVYRSIDLGENNPTACAWIAVDPDGNWYVFDEYYEQNKPTELHAESILLKTGKRRVVGTVLDENGLGKQLLLDYNRYGVKAIGQKHHSVTDGIGRLREKFHTSEITGKPSIFFFRSCDIMIGEVETYQWDNRTSAADVDPKERPLKKNDHLVDCLRNFAMTFFYSRPLSAEELSERRRRKAQRSFRISPITGY